MAVIPFIGKKNIKTGVTGVLPLPDGTVRIYRAQNPGGFEKVDTAWREDCKKCAAGEQTHRPVKGIWMRACAWPRRKNFSRSS